MKSNKLTHGANVMWESSRMMLPEHKESLVKRRVDADVAVKSKRPTRDEFELEDLGGKLSEAKEEGTELFLTVWGQEEKVQGRIVELDARTRLVHVELDGERTKVLFLDIMDIDYS